MGHPQILVDSGLWEVVAIDSGLSLSGVPTGIWLTWGVVGIKEVGWKVQVCYCRWNFGRSWNKRLRIGTTLPMTPFDWQHQPPSQLSSFLFFFFRKLSATFEVFSNSVRQLSSCPHWLMYLWEENMSIRIISTFYQYVRHVREEKSCSNFRT